MKIILEGPDSSGKSTLAENILRQLPSYYSIYRAGGPPKTEAEFFKRIEDTLKLKNVIFDRHSLVSEPIYGQLRGTDLHKRPQFQVSLNLFYNTPGIAFVYCYKDQLSNHEIKPYDSKEHLNLVEQNFNRIVDGYNKWALQYANLIYRYEDPRSKMVPLLCNQMAIDYGACE